MVSVSDVLSQLRIDGAVSIKEQIAGFLRSRIESGRLPPGTQLPSIRSLAKIWNIPFPTVQTGLKPLIDERRLQATQGQGIRVLDPKRDLTCVGIYFREDVWATQSSDFQREVYAAVKEELHEAGVQTQIWIDPRPQEKQATPWRELCKAVERREIQGLIAPAIDLQHLRWMIKLPVASAYMGTSPIPNRVDCDLRQLAELSLHCLAEQGCRSVGLIMPVSRAEGLHLDGSKKTIMGYFDSFTDCARDLGLTMRDEWWRLPDDRAPLGSPQAHEPFGYEQVLNLLNQRQRPEGLVVFPDSTARGVILGLREKQVRVPKELKLVLHRNESVPLFCPMPATFTVLSERACARALIEQMQKQFRGESCEPMLVRCTSSTDDGTAWGGRKMKRPRTTSRTQEE